MQGDALLSRIAGHDLVRSQVNRGSAAYARRRVARLEHSDPVAMQERTLKRLVRKARFTRFGRDHAFASINGVDSFQKAVPIRTYEDLWTDYLKDRYPVFENLTWPGRIPYLALTSGTTQGATKYIPVSRRCSRRTRRPRGRWSPTTWPRGLIRGSFTAESSSSAGRATWNSPRPASNKETSAGSPRRNSTRFFRPYTFPPLELALEPDWDQKLAALAERSRNERITLVAGVPSWLLVLFQRLLDLTGSATIAEVWPDLEVVVHGGVKFDPYREAFARILGDPRIRLQETYPCSEGFIAFGDPATGNLRLVLRSRHLLRVRSRR